MSKIKQQTPPVKPRDLTSTPAEKQQNIRLVCYITKELNAEINKHAESMFGKRRGSKSLYIEQALRIHFRMVIEGVEQR